eukprot:TRINITY_DN6646_c0_g1_i2.p1 TRINITY_DN6646_c0_g1~~TRINITY_DN6646_c0_g1_i2.p1  ORF type:complete len:196 (+),score=32.01 TRINITY_DN6646_c0_g1_i2:105-692(+)
MNHDNVRSLENIDSADFKALCSDYVTTQCFQVCRTASTDMKTISFSLDLIDLPEPLTIHEWIPEQLDVDEYNVYIQRDELSYGYFHEGQLKGMIISHLQSWNDTVNVAWFGISKEFRKKGIGGILMRALISQTKKKKIPMIRCETQTINVPAILFYLKHRFQFDGLELSFYRPDGYQKQDIAVFMKLILTEEAPF